MNLSTQKSVKERVRVFNKNYVTLNTLTNNVGNVGIQNTPGQKTGLSRTLLLIIAWVNFSLTLQLMDELERGLPSQVVSVSSVGHGATPKVPLSNLNTQTTRRTLPQQLVTDAVSSQTCYSSRNSATSWPTSGFT
mmetsp:Transcript_14018/g.25983  ORF Transcript_14018/g.25983 Transcript_14018/m.25983 type:complete len:135 (-) Transcript_14018:554-958(-)